MVKYLQMDGVDDHFKTPSITITQVIMDISVIKPTGKQARYWGLPFGAEYLQWDGSSKDNYTGGIQVFVNDAQQTAGTNFIPNNTRILLKINISSAKSGINYIFNNNGSTLYFAGNIYNLKFYNGTSLVAHYDMSTGTVLDQSGNGNHAILTGGTWLDDGTGGGESIGEDGNAAFDSRLVFYADSTTQADTKQIAYADGTLTTDLRQLLYADQSHPTDTRIAIYQDGATTQDTAQVLYEMSAVAFDTLQELFNDGQVGATPFDVRVQMYDAASAQHDTKQAVYDGGLLRYDVAQVIYESNTAVADVKAVIYADSALKADVVQSIYADGDFNADTLQRILAEFSEYSEVVRIVLEITQRRREAMAISQQAGSDLEIVQRRVIELNL